jgi:amidase
MKYRSGNRQPSAVEWLERLRRVEVSSVELVQQTAARIRSADLRLNAVVAENLDQSMNDAREADRRRSRGERLPLLGLPVTVKDSIDVSGFPCTGGSYARENYLPQQDATCVARLRAAGAIVIAKTNVPEYSSSYETDNAIFGRTVHPLDPDRTPGGSSGGEAALLGADASIVGIGLDGGGSIRVPSHYCGTVGLRPTVGRVPDTGSWPQTRDTGYRDLMCIGPMGRYVEDLMLLLPLISGPDWIDPYAVPAPLGNPRDVEIGRLRVAWFDYDGLSKVSPGTVDTVAIAVDLLARSGAATTHVTPPDLTDATAVFLTSAGADGGTRTRHDLQGSRGRHHVQFQALLESFGASLSLTEFFDLQGRLFEFRRRIRIFMERYDVLICPVTTGPAPRHMEPPWGVPPSAYQRYEAYNYTHALSLAGLPVAVVPCGSEDGLPIGVQIAAQPYQEHIALAAAAVLEAALRESDGR